jgi:Pectate lyase superfamily protein
VTISGVTTDGQPYRSATPEKWQLSSSPATVAIGDVPRLSVVPGVALGLPEATSSARGGIRLTNDLGGTADAPTVVGANSALVTATGSTAARTLAARHADSVNVLDFGAVCDGATDDTAAVQAAVNAAMTYGKELRFPAAVCRIDGQIVLPNDGATPPKQKPLRMVGAGAHMSGRGTAITTGTVLDMRYAGTYGKILTTGLGLLEVTGITFTDGGGGTLPWLYTTNTTLHVHDNGFVGSKTGTACDQDAIILGGTTEVEGQGDPTHGFQGYGTVIRENFFMKTRRAVYGRTFANAVVVRDNTVWSNAGSNLAGGAAIEFDNVAAGATQYDTGNVIAGNLIELVNYPYGIKLGRASQNSVIGNNMFDDTATTLGAVYLGAAAVQNIVIDGYVPGGLAAVVDASTGAVNTHIAIDQAVGSRYATKGAYVFAAEGDGVVQESATSSVPYAHFRTPDGDAVYQRRGGTAGLPGVLFFGLPFGGSAQQLAYVKYIGAAQASVQVNGATFAGLEFPDGDGTVRVKTGNTLWFGDMGGKHLYWQQSTKTLVLNDAAAMVRFGSSTGPLIRQGAGTPEAAVTAPIGSLYLRNDGGAGTTLYVKESGTGNTGWIAMKTAP